MIHNIVHCGHGVLPPLEIAAWRDLHRSTNGSGWTWCHANLVDPCSCNFTVQGVVQGVSCKPPMNTRNKEEQHITAINLPFNSLTGTLPPTLGALSALTSLQLEGNALHSAAPKLTSLQNLTSLDLSGNNLSGELPIVSRRRAASFPRLRTLSLYMNSFSGCLASAFDANAFPSLVNLELDHNLLSGTLPPSLLHAAPLLYSLVLGSNKLSGTLPRREEWESLSALRVLDLRSNPFLHDVAPALNWSQYDAYCGLESIDFKCPTPITSSWREARTLCGATCSAAGTAQVLPQVT